MVSSKDVEVSQKRCLGTPIKSFTGSSPSEQIIVPWEDPLFLDTRNARSTVLLIKYLMIKGNVIYSLGFSPYLILVGRFIAGLGAAFDTVATGELARSYEEKQLTGLIALCNIGESFGFVIAPGLSTIFRNFNVKVGSWQISYKNAGPLVIAILFAVIQFAAAFGAHDLLKEYDLKENNVVLKTEGMPCESKITK